MYWIFIMSQKKKKRKRSIHTTAGVDTGKFIKYMLYTISGNAER